MYEALGKHGAAVYLPAQARRRLSAFRQRQAELMQTLRRVPTAGEVVDSLDLPTGDHTWLALWTPQTASLDQPLDGTGDLYLGDVVVDVTITTYEIVAQRELGELAWKLLAELPAQQAQVVHLRYGLDEAGAAHSLQETARALGLTRDQVKRLEAEALYRLRTLARQSDIQG